MALSVPMLFGILILYAKVSADCLGTMMERRVEVQYLVEETNPYVEDLEIAHDDSDVNRFHSSDHMLKMMFYKIIPLGYKDYMISRFDTYQHSVAVIGCSAYGTSIAEVKSEKDWRNIVEPIRAVPQYYCLIIGLYDFTGENNWEHSQGKKAFYTKFDAEPDPLTVEQKRCVIMTRKYNWTMTPTPCRLQTYCHFVCEMNKS